MIETYKIFVLFYGVCSKNFDALSELSEFEAL